MTLLQIEFQEQLISRVDEYWEWITGDDDSFYVVDARRVGFNPELLLPRPVLAIPSANEDPLRETCVPFGEFQGMYNHNNSAVLIHDMAWGGLDSWQCTLFPSLGEQRQFEPRLMGAIRFFLRSHDGAPGGSLGTTGGMEPVWGGAARDKRQRVPKMDIPIDYWYDLDIFRDTAKVAPLLPADVRSPYLVDLGSCISFAVGWVALVHGLRATLANIQALNEVLANAPLRGFTP
jgi:hypothetical protein